MLANSMLNKATQTRKLLKKTLRRPRVEPEVALQEVVEVFRLDVIGQAFEGPRAERVVYQLDYPDPVELAYETTHGLNGLGLSEYWARRLYMAVFDRDIDEIEYLAQALDEPSTDGSLWHAIEANPLPPIYGTLYPPAPGHFFDFRRLITLGVDLLEQPTCTRRLKELHKKLLEYYPDRAFETWKIYTDCHRLEHFLEDLDLEDIAKMMAYTGNGEEDY